jgi:hypothetical protein
VVAVVTITAEFSLTEPADVAPYEELFDRLPTQALPQVENLGLITEAAARLADE